VHAFRPVFPGRERWVAAAFGLVHGLAFATVIGELGLDARRMALAILGFNVGIEIMQLAVVAAAVPWLVLLARTHLYPAFRTGGSVFGAVAAMGWLGQRAFGWRNPVGPCVEAAARHAPWLLAALAVVSVVATFVGRRDRAPRPLTDVAA
jgi:HupE / UreJ protein